jgi:predicted GNAT family N-acyltransferase
MSFQHHYKPTTLTETEIVEWSEFCAECFSYKVNPPSSRYFQRHFYNDPRRDASLIHVMRYESPKDDNDDNNDDYQYYQRSEMVSSVRVFKRIVSLGRKGDTVVAGGIGEVCTHISHQRKGLAKRLLQFALQNVQENESLKMQISMLHASPQLTKVYESSAGYKSVVSHWSVLPFVLSPLLKQNEEWNSMKRTHNDTQIRLAKFPQDTLALQKIHEEYSQDRLVGCIIRTPEYWNDYLSKEIGDSLFVLTVEQTIVAWMSIRSRSENRFQLREYGIVNSTTLQQWNLTNTDVFSVLLERALEQHISDKESSTANTNSHGETFELHLPTFVLKELRETCLNDHGSDTLQWIDFCNPMIYSEDDHGWMYKLLNANQKNIVDIVEEGMPHLIWPSDSF